MAMKWTTERVTIMDVTARDGFQMEREWIPTAEKIRFINAILAAGIRRIEATSFVSAKAVPQLRDAREVLAAIDRPAGARITVLVPNLRGAEIALDSEVDELTVVVSVSETHNLNNVRQSVQESAQQIRDIAELVRPSGKGLSVGLATTFGCAFEGMTPVDKVIRLVEILENYGIASFALSDTTGMANPRQVYDYVTRVRERFPEVELSLHLHNTRGMGLANIVAGYQAGISSFDASLGGIGGCPFSPGATGNVCTEDVVHMFEEMNVTTGANLDSLIQAARDLEGLLGYRLPGYVMKAGKSSDLYRGR